MKIALYYPWVYLKSGVERTILELIRKSKHRWVVFTSHFDPESTFPEFKEIEIIELKKVSVKRSYPAVLRAALTILSQKLELKNYDALWVLSEGLGNLITLRNHQIPLVCYCYTPLKVIHDSFARSEYLRRNKYKIIPYFIFSSLFKSIDRFTWKKYQHIICVSREVKNRILRAGLVSENKIRVIPLGVDVEKIEPSWFYGNYFFHPTRIKWWKNIELSILSFKKFYNLYQDHRKMKLIIAGQVHRNSKSYYQRLLKLSEDCEQIQIIPNPSNELFQELFRNCYAALSTTLNEDWGIVPLEAMAYGKPVIAVNRGGPQESIIHKKTGFLIEPEPAEFNKAMKLLAEDGSLLREMGRQARERSLEFSWKYFIERIDKFIDSLK